MAKNGEYISYFSGCKEVDTMHHKTSSIRSIVGDQVVRLDSREEIIRNNVHIQFFAEVFQQFPFESGLFEVEISFQFSFDYGKHDVSAIVAQVSLVDNVRISGFLDEVINGSSLLGEVQDRDWVFNGSRLRRMVCHIEYL